MGFVLGAISDFVAALCLLAIFVACFQEVIKLFAQ